MAYKDPNAGAKNPPERILYKGHYYEYTHHTAHKSDAMKEARASRQRGFAVLVRHHYILPNTQYDYYCLYTRKVK